MDACPVTPDRRAAPEAHAVPRRLEPWIRLEEAVESWRADRSGRRAWAALPLVDPGLLDGAGVLDAVDDLVAAVIDADELGFSRDCEALFRRVLGTRCLAALAARRIGRVVHSRWFPVLMRVSSRRRLLCIRLQALHRSLSGMEGGSTP